MYEIEFFSGNTEYDYNRGPDTGEILSYDQDMRAGAWAKAMARQRQRPAERPGEQHLFHGGRPITLEEAVQLVLDRVPGASSEDVRIQLEEEDGRQVYEGEVICKPRRARV